MNIVNKVTLQHMKQNKKKTLVTLIGIILSVALITAISTFAESFLDMMRRDVIASEGEWHVLFYDYPKDRLETLRGDERVKGILESHSLGCAWLEESENPEKPYLGIRAYNDLAMQEYPLTLKEGRMPENSGEIVLPAHLKENGGVDWKVGDTLTLELGTRYYVRVEAEGEEIRPISDTEYYSIGPESEDYEKLQNAVTRTFTVVGIVERPDFEPVYAGSYSAFTYLDEVLLEEFTSVNAAVQLQKLDESLYDWAEKIAGEAGVPMDTNYSLLSFYLLSSREGVVTMLNTLKVLLILIVMLGSIAVIYSSFAISVSERSKYLGMMASVGATKRQKRQSVFFEELLLGAAGIPLGLLVGLLGTFVTMQFINPVLARAFQGMSNTGDPMSMRMVISAPALLGAVLVTVVTIAVSAWIPARRASRITPIDAIRQTQDVKLTKRQVRVSPLTRAVFGFPGELALKNLKRNKKRYRATVLSLILCIALFLSVSAFSIYLSDAYMFSLGAEEDMPDIVMSIDPDDAKELVAAVEEIPGITQSAYYQNWYLYTLTDPQYLSEPAWRMYQEIRGSVPDENGRIRCTVEVIVMENADLEAYAEKAGVSPEELAEDGSHPVLAENVFRYDNGERISIEPVMTREPGENFAFALEEEPERQTGLRVAGFVTEPPYGIQIQAVLPDVRVYMTKEVNEALLEEMNYGGRPYMDGYLQAENPLAVYDAILALQDEYTGINVYSAAAEKQQMEQLMLLMNIFIYSFIILTSLICVTSIFNTISTGMALRRREYAMLESVGMDRKQFHRMIRYESIFYGLKALLYGLPIGFGLMWLIYRVIASSIDGGFYVLWKPIGVAVVSVLIIVGLTMRYSMRKIEKANIVDALKEENV